MYPEGIPDSILRLADLTRPDHVNANEVADLRDRLTKSEGFVIDWVEDERFWSSVSRSDFPVVLSQILPHTTNGEFGLAALIGSRAEIPTDPVFSARKSLSRVPELLMQSQAIMNGGKIETASVLVQILDDLFSACSGGLLLSTNLISQGYGVPVHAGILETGAKTIAGAVRRLRQHLGALAPQEPWL